MPPHAGKTFRPAGPGSPNSKTRAQTEQSVAGRRVPIHIEPRRCDRLPWLSRVRVGLNQATGACSVDRHTSERSRRQNRRSRPSWGSTRRRFERVHLGLRFRDPSRENHGDLPSQQRAMSDLGTPGGTRSIPNASEHHARARATRDHAASRPVSSRTRPRRAKAGARAFPETTTDIARPSVSRLARAGPATNGATSSLANLSLRPGGVSGTGASHARRAMPSPRRRSTARHSRAPRARPRPLAHPFPSVPEKKQNILAPRPQARPSRRSGWEGSPAPSAARTPKPRHERYVARFPSSTAAGRSFGDGSRFARRPLFSFRFFRLFQRARASRVSTANRPVPTLDARLD